MNSQRNAADRVRPFLQAMERSIAAARQRRLNRPTQPALTDVSGNGEDAAHDEGRPRLRARPKRPGGYAPASRYEGSASNSGVASGATSGSSSGVSSSSHPG